MLAAKAGHGDIVEYLVCKQGVTEEERTHALELLGQYLTRGDNGPLQREAELLTEIFKSTVSATNECVDERQAIRGIIKKYTSEKQSTLVQVISEIEKSFNKSLNNIDKAYVERKYIKYCAKFWIDETVTFLNQVIHSKDRNVFEKVLNSLGKVQFLSEVPNIFERMKYYQLLIKHGKYIDKITENKLVSQFQEQCLEQIMTFSSSAKSEVLFLESIIDYLNLCTNFEATVTVLGLRKFVADELAFDQLCRNIMNLERVAHSDNLQVLRQTARDLIGNDPFMKDKIKEVLAAHIKPVTLQEVSVDSGSRLVIEVSGKYIVVSSIIKELESKLSQNAKVDEVRFVGSNVLHIDADLNTSVWRGKNVAVFTEVIKIDREVIWEVSGKDNDHSYSDNAGKDNDGNGKQGSDGYPGESGGNVLIIVDKFENPERLTIKANGGKGSKGQDGGHGKDGADGKGFTKQQFEDLFPPASPLDDVKRVQRVSDTVGYIDRWKKKVNIQWYERYINVFNTPVFHENIVEKVKEDADKFPDMFVGNIFFDAELVDGSQMIFSYQCPKLTVNCQSFLLCKWPEGEKGKLPGEFGLGGQGGFAGSIIVTNRDNSFEYSLVKKENVSGQDGPSGKGGIHGEDGKSGWDIGYMDYAVSGFFTETWPKYFGTDLKSKLSLEYFSSGSSTRIWSPYRRYKGYSAYTDISSCRVDREKRKTYSERKSTRASNERKHHALAVGKKNITHGSLVSSYSHMMTSFSGLAIKSDLERTQQQALGAMANNEKLKTRDSISLKTQRQCTYQAKNKAKHESSILISSLAPINAVDEFENLISKLKKASSFDQSIDDWFQLRNVQTSLPLLEELFLVFESHQKIGTKSVKTQTRIKEVQKILIEKYKLAHLEKIDNLIAFPKVEADLKQIVPENMAKYLVEVEKNEVVSDLIFGNLDQYLFDRSAENESKFINLFKKNIKSIEGGIKIYHSSLQKFILELGESRECTKKYFSEYKEFNEKQKQHLSLAYEAFKKELSQKRVAKVFDLWNKCVSDRSLLVKLEDKIKKDKTLGPLYDLLNEQSRLKFDWNPCFGDKTIEIEHEKYMQEQGVTSGSFRELIAYVFKINLRVYAENENGMLYLHDSHNPSSIKTVHVLNRVVDFFQMVIDEGYLKLEANRLDLDETYERILLTTESLLTRKELIDYFSKQNFSTTPNMLNEGLNEDDDIAIIADLFTENGPQLKTRLLKIRSDYIGKHSILRYLRMRFNNEGVYISIQELYFLITSVITSVIEGREELNIFCWIVAAYSQQKWIDELILLQLENYFKRTLKEKTKWRQYLAEIKNKDILLLFDVRLNQHRSFNTISIQSVDETLRLLSYIPSDIVNVGALDLSEWTYALKEKYWTCKLSGLIDWPNDDLIRASFYLIGVENLYGTESAERLIVGLQRQTNKLSPTVISEILSNCYGEKWNLTKIELDALDKLEICEWMLEMQQKFAVTSFDRDITQLIKIIEGNENTSVNIKNALSQIETAIKEISKENYTVSLKSVNIYSEDDIKKWSDAIDKNAKARATFQQQIEMLAMVNHAIKLKRRFHLRHTQMLSVLSLLTNGRSTLAQVSTGEGKSLIVVAASIIKALCGEQVDIITSSSVLAKRDADGNRDIYNLFGINVSHNCSEDIEKRRESYSANQVVYGDLGNFQRDYLLDRFYDKHILGDRNFNSVFVDEVDSMLLDKGNNILYLSHDLAGLDKIESVYLFIWQWLNRPAVDMEQLEYAFDVQAIQKGVINDLYGVVDKSDIARLNNGLSEHDKTIIWEGLINNKVLNTEGRLLVKDLSDIPLEKVLSSDLKKYLDHLKFLLKNSIERERSIHIPNYLRGFVEQHLEGWINNAKVAFFMKPGEDYVVDVDKTGTSPDRNPIITILDRDTGTDQANSQWDEGLHQFLQLKHGCKLSLQSLKAVFISNVSFFKLYNSLYGLTGTLGSQRERELLQEIHKVDFVTIPPAKSKLFVEETPIICSSKDQWADAVCCEISKFTDKQKRSALIICDSVNDVHMFYKSFKDRKVANVHTYVRDFEQFEIIKGDKELEPGHIIIATNLAGRGTDVKITQKLKEAKGLHVCLTYLPNNLRVEQQAFGRAARSGDPGSGQLIIVNEAGQEYSNTRIFELKKERDAQELFPLSDVKNHYETQIVMEEDCFKDFQTVYNVLRKEVEKKKFPPEIKTILLQSCIDKWSFWLDENNKYIKEAANEQDKKRFKLRLNSFLAELKKLNTGKGDKWLPSHDYSAWVAKNPVQMVKLGRELSKIGQLDNALQLFNGVIDDEPYFSESAYYYKAFAIGRKINWEKTPVDRILYGKFKKSLREAAKMLQIHSRFCMSAASVIGRIKKSSDEGILKIDAFEEQQKSLANLYYMFSQSIDDIFGHAVTPESLINGDVMEESAEDLFKGLLSKGALKNSKVKNNINPDELNSVCAGFGIDVKDLTGFLSCYEGKNIELDRFRKTLKKGVPLPSRESFWKVLINQYILIEEVQYIKVNRAKLERIDSLLYGTISNNIENGKLVKRELVTDSSHMLLYLEWLSEMKDNEYLFLKHDFVEVVGQKNFKMLKDKGAIMSNRRASVVTSKIKNPSLPKYDSMTLQDLMDKVGISRSDAEDIIADMVQQNVLEKHKEHDMYSLKIKFDDIKMINLPNHPVYDNAVKEVLFACFIYRGTIQNIEEQIANNTADIKVKLMPKPHQCLFLELLEQRIIKPVTVAITDKDELEKVVKEVLHNLKVMNPDDATKNVVRALNRAASSLKSLKVPNCKLESFNTLSGEGDFGNIQERQILSLNGLDYLLQLDEKKWTWEMLINTGIVIIMGICQIALGTIIELYSVGLMTHVGGALISEGVSDLMYAVNALRTGHFSWKDYRQYKIESIMISVATAGVGALLSKGAKVSRYGHKLYGPSLELGKASGTQLIKIAGTRVIAKEVAKRIALKAAEGIFIGAANAGVDALVDRYIQGFAESVASGLMASIEANVDEHKINATLKEFYELLGEEKASRLINEATQNAFSEKTFASQIISFTNKVANVLTQGIASAVEKRAMTGNALTIPIHVISKLLAWKDRATHVAEIYMITGEFLNRMDSKLTEKKQHVEKISKNPEGQLDFESFKRKHTDQWKVLLRQRAGQIISQNLVSPVMKSGANRLVRCIGRQVKGAYRSYKERCNAESLEKLKQEHKESLQGVPQCSERSTIVTQLTEKYHSELRKLMVKTRSSALLANIIREHVEMDLTCVHACAKVMEKILREHGIPVSSFKIVIEGENGLRETFSSANDSSSEVTVKLDLKDNHFQFCGSGESASGNNSINNNCLYDALVEAFPELRGRISPEVFREKAAHCIEHDEEIKHHVEQGWHRLPVAMGIYGGGGKKRPYISYETHVKRVKNPRREKTDVIIDDSSTVADTGEHDVAQHIVDRFLRTYDLVVVYKELMILSSKAIRPLIEMR